MKKSKVSYVDSDDEEVKDPLLKHFNAPIRLPLACLNLIGPNEEEKEGAEVAENGLLVL